MKLIQYNVSQQFVFICVATTFGFAVPVGYNLGIINAPASFIQKWCEDTLNERQVILTPNLLNVLWAAIVAIFLVGGAVGSFCAGWIADKFGRKIPLLVSAGFFISGAAFFALCRLASSIEMLLIGRFLSGVGAGISSSTAPMYLTEIAILNLRGSIGALMELGVTIGLLLAQIISLEEMLGTEQTWHCALSLSIVLVILGVISSGCFPESPKYLYILRGEKEKGIKVIAQLRNTTNSNEIDEEIQSMENEITFKSSSRSVRSVLTDQTLLLPIVLVCCMQAGQQLSGVNAVYFYSVSIFEKAGIMPTDAKWANIGTGLVAVVTVSISSAIMSKIDRRIIILTSCFFSAVFMAILFVVILIINSAQWLSYVSIVAVIGFIFAFEFGLGPLPLFIGSELLESPPRPVAMALGSVSSWTCNFLVGMTFPILESAWGSFVFIPYITVSLALTVLLWFYLPETRGKTSSEIAALINNGFKSKPLGRK